MIHKLWFVLVFEKVPVGVLRGFCMLWFTCGGKRDAAFPRDTSQ